LAIELIKLYQQLHVLKLGAECHSQLVSSAAQQVVGHSGFIAAIKELLASGEQGLLLQKLVLGHGTNDR